MQKVNKVYIVGIGYKPLDMIVRDVLLKADLIFSSQRLGDVFKRYPEYASVQDRIIQINNVDDTIQSIRSELQRPVQRTIVLLASGDPLFFGIGRRMLDEFGRERVEIMPDLSSIQTAFAKIGLAWDDAFLISLHGGPDPRKRRRLPYDMHDIPALLRIYGKIAILTDRENGPAAIAEAVASMPLSEDTRIIMHVCQKLGYPDESIWTGDPGDAPEQMFRDPNVVILQLMTDPSLKEDEEAIFGLMEREFSYSAGLITKDEIRAATIHRLRLPKKGVFWDIGAGSGSISIEAARLSPWLRVFAIEMEQDRIETIKRNIKQLRAYNIKIVHGTAPEVLLDLPQPDRVFIGGSSGRLGDIIMHVGRETNARIVVVNAATIQTLNQGISILQSAGFNVDVSGIQVSRSRIISGNMHLNSLNPVFIIRAERV